MTTVLLIDDDPAVCRSVGRLLRFMKFKVLVATSGREALTLIESNEPIDVVISDVQMPDMDGHQVAEAFADRCPVILMSGALEQQLKGVLAKPFTPNELLSELHSALPAA